MRPNFLWFFRSTEQSCCGNVKTTHPSHASRVPPSLLGKARRLRRATSLPCQCRIPLLCHCEPVLRLVWQSRTRSNVSAGTRRFPRQCAHCLGMTEKVSLRTSAAALVWQSPGYSDCPKGMPLGAILVLLQPERAFHSFCLPHRNNIQKLPIFPRKLILPFPEKGLTPVFGYVIVIN